METNIDNQQISIVIIQEIYKHALRNRFITLDEARSISGNDNTARMVLWRLSKRGNLIRVRSGLYAAVPLENDQGQFEVDRYLLANRLVGENGALAFHTALEVHGVAYSQFNRVFYISNKKSTPFHFQDIDYRPVLTSSLFGFTTVYIDEIRVKVTDKERTFLDCLRRLDLCGGLEEFLKSVEGFTLMSPPKLLDYLERFGEQSLYQRTGFILEQLKGTINVEDDLMQVLRGRVSVTPTYLVPGSQHVGGRLVKDWNVLVPRNLEEIARFV